MRKILIFLILIIYSQYGFTQKKDSTGHEWVLNGEMFGSAIAISLQGEYISHRPLFDYSLRSGIGRTSLYHERGEGIAENLTFPVVFSVSKKLSLYTPLWLELGAGGAVDLFEHEESRWIGDRLTTEKYVSTLIRIIPVTLGFKQVNRHGFQWRYYLLLNVVPNKTTFVMGGISFGGLL